MLKLNYYYKAILGTIWRRANEWIVLKHLTVERIAILVYKQIISNSFKNDISDKLIWHITYLFKCVQTNDKLFLLHRNTWNQLSVQKWAPLRLKMLRKYLQNINLIYIYKQDFALNRQQRLIYHKIKPKAGYPGYDTKLHLIVKIEF